MSSDPVVRVRHDGAIARLTLERPERRNALDARLLTELHTALTAAEADPAIRVVTLTGAGADFCAGADLKEIEESLTAELADRYAEVDRFIHLLLAIRALRTPVVALVRGRALAGGCGLAIGCDLVLAAEDARFGLPEVALGFVPAIVMALVRRQLPEKRAFEMIALGASYSAAEAERWGLVNRVFLDGEFEERAEALVQALARSSPTALQLSKRLLYHQDGMTLEAALRAGGDINLLARTTPDLRAGLAHFLNHSPGA